MSFNLRQFMLAGEATFTVTSLVTGTRFTFKSHRKDCGEGNVLYFVSLLNGPDNTGDFTFIGTIFDVGSPLERYEHGRRSRVGPDAPSAKAAYWVINRTLAGQPLNGVKVNHEGRCGRCGRVLTVPESIASAFGPECINHV